MNATDLNSPERWKRMLERQAALAGENYRLLDIALREIEALKLKLREVAR